MKHASKRFPSPWLLLPLLGVLMGGIGWMAYQKHFYSLSQLTPHGTVWMASAHHPSQLQLAASDFEPLARQLGDSTMDWQPYHRFLDLLQQDSSLRAALQARSYHTLRCRQGSKYHFAFLVERSFSPFGPSLREVCQALEQTQGYKLHSRYFAYQDIFLLERGSEAWQLAAVGNFWLLTDSGLLAEQLIRTAKGEVAPAPMGEAQALPAGYRLWMDPTEMLYAWMQMQGGKYADRSFARLLQMAQSIQLDSVQMRNQQWQLHGQWQPAEEEWLEALQGQQPQPDGIWGMLTHRSLGYMRFSVSDGGKLQQQLAPAPTQLLEQWGYRPEVLFGALRQEVGWVFLPSEKQPNGYAKLLLAGISPEATPALQQMLQQLSEQSCRQAGKLPSKLRYKQWEIGRIAHRELPAALLQGPFQGFGPEAFYTFADGYLAIGSELLALEQWLEERQAKKAWKAHQPYAPMAQQAARPSWVSGMLHTPAAWKQLMSDLQPKWQQRLEGMRLHWLQYKFWQLRLQADGQLEGFVLLQREASLPQQPTAARTLPLQQRFRTTLSTPAASSPELVLHPADKSTEVLLQDQAHKLLLFDAKGRRQWALPLGMPLAQGLQQVQLEGQWCYLFGAGNRLYAVSRAGKALPGFPLQVPVGRIAHTAFWKTPQGPLLAAADAQGNIFAYTAKGQKVAGWQPKRLLQPLAIPPQCLEIGRQPTVVALSEQGKAVALDLSGKEVAGSPMLFNTAVPSDNAVWRAASSADLAYLMFMSRGGELVKTSLSGKVLLRKRLGEASTERHYFLLQDQVSQDQWLLGGQHEGNIALIDLQGRKVFEKRIPGLRSRAQLQYFHFGADAEFICITAEGKSQLFFLNGQPALDKPIESTHPPRIRYSAMGKSFLLFAGNDKAMTAYQISRKR